MIRIGDFARLCQLSVPTLRHYDEIGLLKPVSVDSFTGYRYYSVSQLPRLNRILALKDLGFTLDQIVQVLAEDISAEQLRGMLTLKRAEAEQQVAETRARLTRIEARLRQIEQEETMPNYEVILKTVPPIRVASRTVTIPTNDQVPQYLDMAYKEAWEYLNSSGAKATGPCFALWNQGADILANEVAEAAFPIDRALPGSDTVRVYELPQVQVAAAVHHGAFENFTQLHGALLTWIEANGYHVTGPYREIYIDHDPNHMNEAATEVQYPVEKN
jgi:DNA-binding transcriptional MerR regulator